MAVYVDPLMNHGMVWHGKVYKSCHLFADRVGELLAFALKIWLKREWLQGVDRQPPFPHFDLIPSKRRTAVRAGAVELTREEAVAKWKGNPPPGYKVRMGAALGNGRWVSKITAPDGFTWHPTVQSKDEAISSAWNARNLRTPGDRP